MKESKRAQIKRLMTKARAERGDGKRRKRQSERQRALLYRVNTKRKEEEKRVKGKERKAEHRSRLGRKSERGMTV